MNPRLVLGSWSIGQAWLTKILNVGGTRLQAMFDIDNVFNENVVTEEDRNFGPNYLNPTAIMPGRLATFAFQINF